MSSVQKPGSQPIVINQELEVQEDSKIKKMPQDVNAPFVPRFVKNSLVISLVIGTIILALGLCAYFGVTSHLGFMVHLSPTLTHQISLGMIAGGATLGGGGLIGSSIAYGIERKEKESTLNAFAEESSDDSASPVDDKKDSKVASKKTKLDENFYDLSSDDEVRENAGYYSDTDTTNITPPDMTVYE